MNPIEELAKVVESGVDHSSIPNRADRPKKKPVPTMAYLHRGERRERARLKKWWKSPVTMSDLR